MSCLERYLFTNITVKDKKKNLVYLTFKEINILKFMKQKDVITGASKMLGVKNLNIINFEQEGLDNIGADDVDDSLLVEGDI